MVERKEEDADPQPGVPRPRGERRQGQKRGGIIGIARSVVFGGPDRVEAILYRQFSLFEGLLKPVWVLGGAKPEFHSALPNGGTPSPETPLGYFPFLKKSWGRNSFV
jgi:hypothetical protein